MHVDLIVLNHLPDGWVSVVFSFFFCKVFMFVFMLLRMAESISHLLGNKVYLDLDLLPSILLFFLASLHPLLLSSHPPSFPPSLLSFPTFPNMLLLH